jgi:leader peptidase (prepilin peptidase)/N-methyltransferase
MTYFLVTAGSARMAGMTISPLTATTIGRGTVTVLVAVVGLMIGSFLNVVIYRVPRHLSVAQPRSFCPQCDTPLRSIDNVPLVSWLVLGGRCRQCRAPISVRYPLVELSTALVFAAVGWGLGPHWAVAGYCVLAATFVALVAVEADGLAPPLSAAAVGTGLATAVLVGAGAADRRWSHVIGVMVGAVFAAAVVAVSRRRRWRERTEPARWTDSTAALLPAGAALGWLGPAGVGEGLAAAAIVLLVARALEHRPSTTRRGKSVLALALAIGVTVAVVTAVARGTGAGL